MLATVQGFRAEQVKKLPTEPGVYALCDLDGKPIYVGQTKDGLRARIRRHLTSARSDSIANRQLDVWEVAFVKVWRVPNDLPLDELVQQLPAVIGVNNLSSHVIRLNLLETEVFLAFNGEDPQAPLLFNGAKLKMPPGHHPGALRAADVEVQVITDDERAQRRDAIRRMPRQVSHLSNLVDHILNVKDAPELRASLAAHFARLDRYRREFLRDDKTPVLTPDQEGPGEET